jgi:2,4-dienoyl-CoA reductase-like NADH-dependent reductase (Old Yellow Enzyme family)/thioredoxin reductase
MPDLEHVFIPISVGSLQLKNRIIMPPSIQMIAMDDTFLEHVKNLFVPRARGGVGLIMMTSLKVANLFDNTTAYPGIYDDCFIPGLKEIADAIHANGAAVGVKLSHPGRHGEPRWGDQPIAPSAIPVGAGGIMPKELSLEEIERIIEHYVRAAQRARDAGFDIVELHAAHGYLAGSFLSPHTNRRTDKYGGDVVRRAQFAIEIVQGIKKRLKKDFPVSCRINGADNMAGGTIIDTARATARLLQKAGVDLISVSSGLHGSYPVIVPPYDQPKGVNVPLAESIKQEVSVPVAVAGRIDDLQLAEEILASGKADLVAMGRALLADPDLIEKSRSGRLGEIRHCIGCNVCIDQLPTPPSPVTCTVNPEAGREKEMEIATSLEPKKVLVAGGGLAGLEAARIAALRGHEVCLYEEDEELGGQWLLASTPPHKQEHRSLVDYLVGQLDRLGVKVVTGTRATMATVEELQPDVVIVATGATPLVPQISGIEQKEVITAWDALRGYRVGERVLVIGGGSTGLETAEFLATKGKEVRLVEQLERVGTDMEPTVRWHLLQRTKKLKLKITPLAEVRQILPGGTVVLARDGTEETWPGFDSIVLAVGARSRRELAEQVATFAKEVHVIGDAAKARRGLDAIRDGAEVGRRI